MHADRSLLLWGSAAVWLAVVGLAGCDDVRRRHESLPATMPADSLVVMSDPIEFGREFLAAIRHAQSVRSGGLRSREQRQTYREAMSRVASFAAARDIQRAWLAKRSPLVPVGISEQEVARRISESWVSQMAYYVDGLLLETLRVISPAADPAAGLDLYVEGERPADRERLEAILASHPGGATIALPASPNAAAASESVRTRTLSAHPAFNTPIRAAFRIRIRQVDGRWRVTRVTIEQPFAEPPTPTVQPPLQPPPPPVPPQVEPPSPPTSAS